MGTTKPCDCNILLFLLVLLYYTAYYLQQAYYQFKVLTHVACDC